MPHDSKDGSGSFADLPADIRAKAEALINVRLHRLFWGGAAKEFGLSSCPLPFGR